MAVTDFIAQTYWSSHDAETFTDRMNAFYQGDTKVVGELRSSLPHFAYGFANGVWGDLAIPLVLAGASGALGQHIRQNIWWACGIIGEAFNAMDWEAIGKLGAIYAINNKAMIAGKITGTNVMMFFYKKLGIKFNVFFRASKIVANAASLAIIGFISHKEFITKLTQSEQLFVFLYVLITGDNNLIKFNDSPGELKLVISTLSKEIDKIPLSELNAKYQEIEFSMMESKKIINAIKHKSLTP